MIEIHTHKTARTAGTLSYQTYDTESKKFNNEKEASEYLKDKYFHCKTLQKHYQDDKNGKNARHTGYIYCYKDKEYNRATTNPKTIYFKDWVHIYKSNPKTIILK